MAPSTPTQWTTRERVWNVLRMQTQPWTFAHIIAVAEAKETFVRSFVNRLQGVGYVKRIGEQHPASYQLVRNTGPIPPRIERNGNAKDLNIKAATPGATQRMWALLRDRKIVDTDDLEKDALVNRQSAAHYMRELLLAGIVQKMPPAPGISLREARYQLVRDAGPTAPPRKSRSQK